MCKFNPKNDSRRIDPCMVGLIKFFKSHKNLRNIEVLGSCCGHGKYPMTIVVQSNSLGIIYELMSDKEIPRERRFYKKDEEGYYYIPEVKELK